MNSNIDRLRGVYPQNSTCAGIRPAFRADAGDIRFDESTPERLVDRAAIRDTGGDEFGPVTDTRSGHHDIVGFWVQGCGHCSPPHA